MRIQRAVDTENAILTLLRNLYKSVEGKEVSGLYGSSFYYLVGEGDNQLDVYKRQVYVEYPRPPQHRRAVLNPRQLFHGVVAVDCHDCAGDEAFPVQAYNERGCRYFLVGGVDVYKRQLLSGSRRAVRMPQTSRKWLKSGYFM